MGINVNTLVKTMETYNGYVKAGTDKDFAKKCSS